MERLVGTISRGIRCPIIREGDNLVDMTVDSVLAAAQSEGFELRDRDVIGIYFQGSADIGDWSANLTTSTKDWRTVNFNGNKVKIKTSGVKQIAMTTFGRKTKAFNAKNGEPITEAEFELIPSYEYFRITVTDFEGKHALTQAYKV